LIASHNDAGLILRESRDSMKIAIHDSPGSFSDGWIDYCRTHQIEIKIVNCYDTDIIEQLRGCDALMWHHKQNDSRERLFAKQLLFAVQQGGLITFPNYRTFWHFDDKIAQKYLFESIRAPLVPSYVFYSKKEALHWIHHTRFPKVFKLKGGAGSASVYLVRSASQARSLVRRAFGRGISQFDPWRNFLEQLRLYRQNGGSITRVLKGIYRYFIYPEYAKTNVADRNYVYFQDFIPNNEFDTRIIVIDRKAFAVRRMVRRGDFRASGSGNILYGKENFSAETIKLAFDLARKLQSQCAAFDFVHDQFGQPMVTEVSYGFVAGAYKPCVGYWDESLEFHDGAFNFLDWMVEVVVDSIRGSRAEGSG